MPEISLFCGIRITMFYSDHSVCENEIYRRQDKTAGDA